MHMQVKDNFGHAFSLVGNDTIIAGIQIGQQHIKFARDSHLLPQA